MVLDLVENSTDKLRGNRIDGVVLGIVVNNQDTEKLGRVKLKFPWLDDYQTDWARVSTFMAGKGRGAFFLPEVDDEVIVAFDHGDINHPYVLGSLWNGADKPIEDNSSGKNEVRKIKSRSGHEIIFTDDKDGKKEKIEIQSNAGHSILLDDSSGGEKIEIKDKTGNNSILIDSAQNSINIASQAKLSIKSKDVSIESDGMMTIKASGNLTIQGSLVKIN